MINWICNVISFIILVLSFFTLILWSLKRWDSAILELLTLKKMNDKTKKYKELSKDTWEYTKIKYFNGFLLQNYV